MALASNLQSGGSSFDGKQLPKGAPSDGAHHEAAIITITMCSSHHLEHERDAMRRRTWSHCFRSSPASPIPGKKSNALAVTCISQLASAQYQLGSTGSRGGEQRLDY